MQRLHAASEHLRPAGEVGDVAHLDAGFAQQLGRAAGRKNLEAQRGETLGELDDSCFVKHADERALHRHEFLRKSKAQ
jgi:hypothetical protein